MPRGRPHPDRHKIPSEGWRAFQSQRDGARRRGIPFLFDAVTWWEWWQTDDRWSRRGISSSSLCMARIGDKGPYSPENVVCQTHAQNVYDVPVEVWSEAQKRTWLKDGRKAHKPTPLFYRGEAHPQSKPVLTPKGRFGNAREAAEAYQIHSRTAQIRAAKRMMGWSYESDGERPL